MTITTQGCPVVGFLKDGVQRAALSVQGVKAAEVAATYDTPWSPDRVSGPAADQRSTEKPRFWRPW